MRDDPWDNVDIPPAARAPQTWICPRHGTYARNLKAGWHDAATCPACMDAGKAIKAPWRQAWTTYNRWQRVQAPDRFRNRRFGNFRAETAEQQRALEAAQLIARGDIQALALIGSVGTGKTHLSVAITAEVVRAGRECLWVSIPDLFRKWKAAFAKGAEISEQQIIDRINQADLLVLDEIGVGNRSEWEAATLFHLIDERYRDGGSLVLTGNCASLAAAIGDRAADRIDEMGLCITLTGESYRSKATEDPGLQVPDDFTEPPASIELVCSEEGIERRERFEAQHPTAGKASHQPLGHSR